MNGMILRIGQIRYNSRATIAAGLTACALAVAASPLSASATGLGGARTAQCPSGKTVQLHWQNTGTVDLIGTPSRDLNLNDYIATYGPGRNSYNTGREVFSWIFGFVKPGDIVDGTNAYDCVSFKA